MKGSSRPKTILIWLALAAFPKAAAADSTAGAAFLQVNPSAHAYALGNSVAVTALGAEALGSNPANMGLMTKRFDLVTAYASLLDGAAYEHFGGAMALDSGILGIDALGVSFTRVQNSGFQTADSQGNLTGGSFGAGDTAASIGGSARLNSNLRLGLAGKMIQSTIGGYSSNLALAGDLGMTYTAPMFGRKPVSIAASLVNVGPGIRFIQQTDKLPTAANLGVAVPLGPAMFIVEINRLVNQQQTTVSTGLEYAMGPVSLRGGYLAQNNSSNLALKDEKNGALLGSVSGGVGLRFGAAQLDYAVSQQAVEFGMTQRVTLSLQWGGATSHSSSNRDGWHSQDRSDWIIRSMGSY